MASLPPSAHEAEGDRLRVTAMLGVFLTHALYAYAPSQGGWPTDAAAATTIIDFLVYALHVLPMPLFFSLAGRYAARSLRRRGARAFLLRRAARLGLPFLVGMLTIVPATYFLLVYGSVAQSGAPHDVAYESAVGFFEDGHYLERIRVAHLWFFVYLFLLSVGAVALTAVPGGRRPAPSLVRRIAPAALVLGAFLLLFTMPGHVVEEPSGIVPSLPLLSLFALFFAHGWLLAETDPVQPAARHAFTWLLTAIACALLSYAILHEAWPLDAPVLGQLLHVLTAVAAFHAALHAVALAGSRTSGAVRLLAKASMVVYVVHLPLVLLAQVLLMQSAVSPVLRFPLTALSALAGSMLVWWTGHGLASLATRARSVHA